MWQNHATFMIFPSKSMFFIVDNTVREKTPSLIRKVLGDITKWSKQLPKNRAAREWMKNN